MSDTTEIDVDATLAEIESSGSSERPMQTPAEPAPETPAAPQEYEFNWNGRAIKAPMDKFQQWASQGYDYSQKMNAFKQQQMELEGMRKSYEPFKEVDAYARQNPGWWEHVQSQWQSRAQQQSGEGGIPPELSGAIDPIKNELNELKQWKNQLETEKLTQQRQQEDQQLDSEIQSIREKHKDLDWARIDEEGHTLEQRVLQHAMKSGVRNFSTAFRDYMYDEQVKRAESRGRELAIKERQEQVKRGLLGKSSTPTKNLTPATNFKNKSYDDLRREAMEEFGIT